ncbi:MAG TPA: hypothetical protein EYQ00_06970 [Dehalococcoidia bacterium]|nr:hypothetical protein [Dehalococcoidia bacterium]
MNYNTPRPHVLFVGAFPPTHRKVFGGNVTDCKALLESSFPEHVELTLLDSTQISNPGPSSPVRVVLAIKRLIRFLILFERRRPDALLLFSSGGASLLEKATMAWWARLRSVPSLIFPGVVSL